MLCTISVQLLCKNMYDYGSILGERGFYANGYMTHIKTKDLQVCFMDVWIACVVCVYVCLCPCSAAPFPFALQPLFRCAAIIGFLATDRCLVWTAGLLDCCSVTLFCCAAFLLSCRFWCLLCARFLVSYHAAFLVLFCRSVLKRFPNRNIYAACLHCDSTPGGGSHRVLLRAISS